MTDLHLPELIQQYWPYVGVAAALVVVAILYLILGRSQSVDLPPPTLEDEAPRATLPRPAPAAPAVPPPPPPPEPVALDLTRLKGVGPKLAATLVTLGVTSVADIAALGETDAQAIDAQLGTFKGRLARDRVVEQARLLAGGDIAAYEAQFGKLDASSPL